MAMPLDNTQPPQDPQMGAAPGPDDAGAQPDAGGAPDDGGDAATPELQQLYKEFVLNGHQLIYSPKTFQIIVQKLRAGAQQDPIGVLAGIVVMICMRLYQEQPQMPLGLVMKAGTELIDELAMISEKAGAHTYDDKEKQAALYRGVDQFRVMLVKQGKGNPDQAKQELQGLKAADQSGDLAKMIPPGTVGGHMGMAAKPMPKGRGMMATRPAPAPQGV